MSNAGKYVCAFGGRRDYYQVPIALAEYDMLDTFITDAYYFRIPTMLEGVLPARMVENIRFRQDPRIPSHRVKCLWGMLPERQLRRRAGYSDWQVFAKLDRKLSLAAADRARQSRSNLLLYNPYAWEAFTSRYTHAPKRVLFQFHPHPDFERRILLDDSERYRFFNYSYEDEMGSGVDETVKQRTRDCWRHADLILCASEFSRRSLIEAGADQAKCQIVPYGIDLPTSDGASLVSSSFHVLFVGSGTQRKGLHHLILAWQKATLPKDSRLTVVCRSIDPGLKQLVLRASGVEFVRGLSGIELRKLFASSALLAMPSLVEGFGQVYLEALAEGCPVLGTSNTCLPDIGPSPAISIVEPGAIDQLIAELEVLSCVLPGNKEIRAHARECAARWPWSLFREGLCAALNPATAASTGHSGIGSKSLSSRAPDELAR